MPAALRRGGRLVTRYSRRITTLALAVPVIAAVAWLLVRGTAAATLHFGLPGDPDGAGTGAACAVGLLVVLSCLAVPAACALAGRRRVRQPSPGQGPRYPGGEQPNAFLWAIALGRRLDAEAAARARQKQLLIESDDPQACADTCAHPWHGEPCALCAASNDLSFGGLKFPVPFESHGHEAVHG